jgi:hypothetical protein
VLRLQCKTGLEDHLSIQNSDNNPNTGMGVFAEHQFYKGSVISLYVGQPLWIALAAGCNIPMESYVQEIYRQRDISSLPASRLLPFVICKVEPTPSTPNRRMCTRSSPSTRIIRYLQRRLAL